MRAFEIRNGFGLDHLSMTKRPVPQPGPGQVLVQMTAASLNYRDLLVVEGSYNPKLRLPMVPVSDGAGVIEAVGWLGLTTRRYQSGEVDYDGHISRRGDAHVRGLLYEAATVMLTRTHAECGLRAWRLWLKGKLGFKRAAVAVVRKLAVIMHAMLVSAQRFDRSAGLASANG
jgi:hypothetical protein